MVEKKKTAAKSKTEKSVVAKTSKTAVKTTVKKETKKEPVKKASKEPVKKVTRKPIVKKVKKSQERLLVDTIIEAMIDKKGEHIVSLDMCHFENFICNYFVICHANSSTQVNAIADYIEEKVRKELKEKPWHKEGMENSQWVLIDYANVVVHIFQTGYRDFYDLENLWADAKISVHS